MSSKDPLSITLIKKASLANKNKKNGVSIKQFLASSKSAPDSDDSFDLFLPAAVRKCPEPPVGIATREKENTQKQCPVCLGTFSNVKLHLKHCAKKHKLSDTSISEALQLQKDYSTHRKTLGLPSSSLEPDGDPKQTKKGKLKLHGKYLLLKRTQEERTNIIMEKVGILLAQEEDTVEFKAGDVEVGSPFLQDIVDKDSKLWEKAKKSEGSMKEFYVEPIRPFIDIPSPAASPNKPERPPTSLSQASTEIASPELVCISSSQDSCDSNSGPKLSSFPEVRSSPEIELVDVSSGSPSPAPEGLVDSSTRLPSPVLDGVVAESRSPSPIGHDEGHGAPEEHAELNFHKAQAESTRLDNTLEPDNEELSRTLRDQLAEDWGTFIGGAYKSDIEVKLQGSSFYIHSIVLFVRCPVLLSETHRSKTLEWPDVPLEVCEAFFSFIYAAQTDKISNLSCTNLQTLRELCTRYKLGGLDELFEHLGPKRASLKRRMSEDLFGSPKKRRSSPELVDLTVSSPDIMDSIPASPSVEPDRVQRRDSNKDVEDLSPKPIAFEESGDEIVELSQNRKRNSLENHNEDLDQNILDETLNYNEGVIHFSPDRDAPSTSKNSIDKYFQESFPNVFEVEPQTSSPQVVVSSKITPQGDMHAQLRTPSPGVIVSDKVTPQLDYSNLLSPQLQSELKKYGLKPGIGKRKAKMLLRYIYDQIHPVIPENDASGGAAQDAGEGDSDSSSSSEVSEAYVASSDSEDEEPICHGKDFDSVKQAVVSFIKADYTLYDAVLRFTPIWLDEFQQSLKEKGIKCSKNMLKDVLDSECVAYRTKRREVGQRRRRRPKRGRGRELRL